MRKRSISILLLSVAVCLFALVTSMPAAAQKKSTQTAKTTPAKTKVPPTTPATATAKTTSAQTTAATTAPVTVKTETAQSGAFMSALEKEILDEMNLARAEPQKYAAFVEEFKKFYDGNKLSLPGRKKALITNEGTAAVDEAITFLRGSSPLPALASVKGMCLAAKDHAGDLALKGISGHRGSDGSLPNARVERYGRWEGTIGETIVYELTTARQVVISLIIDDGVPNRGHRRNIFDPSYKVAGVSIVESPTNGARCVVDYAGSFREMTVSGGN